MGMFLRGGVGMGIGGLGGGERPDEAGGGGGITGGTGKAGEAGGTGKAGETRIAGVIRGYRRLRKSGAAGKSGEYYRISITGILSLSL